MPCHGEKESIVGQSESFWEGDSILRLETGGLLNKRSSYKCMYREPSQRALFKHTPGSGFKPTTQKRRKKEPSASQSLGRRGKVATNQSPENEGTRKPLWKLRIEISPRWVAQELELYSGVKRSDEILETLRLDVTLTPPCPPCPIVGSNRYGVHLRKL